MTDTPADAGTIEFRIVVWMAPGESWHARVVAPADRTERDFANPFERARFPARPGRACRPEARAARGCPEMARGRCHPEGRRCLS